MSVYHKGEVAVQEQAGVRQMATRVAGGIRDYVPPAAAEFLARQSFVVGSIVDTAGNVWAVPVPGPLHLRDEHTVIVPANLSGAVGFMIMDFATRRRMRLNGIVETGMLTVAECYANCPKYIQKREAKESIPEGIPLSFPVSQDDRLSEAQKADIHRADTFFIATRNGDRSADASHRGGNPGFVQVIDPQTLQWQDYAGNTMFNTLGNLNMDNRAGLFFPDFRSGNALLLSGTAQVIWDTQGERAVRFTVRHVTEQTGMLMPQASDTVEYSPFNPDLPEEGFVM